MYISCTAYTRIRDEHPRHIGKAFEQLAEKLLRGLLVAPTLDENVQDDNVLVHGPPQIVPLTIDCQEDLVQMPFVARLQTTATQAIGILLPKLPTPLTDGFMGHRDAALGQQFFHITVAQGEAIIEPDAMADDLAGEAVVLVAVRVSRWRHVGCLF